MSTKITEFVMNHPLFSHHDHHCNFSFFDEERESFDYRSLLGYASADLITAAGARDPGDPESEAWVSANRPAIRTTGYGRAVSLGCKHLFGIEYSPDNFADITAALKAAIHGKTAAEAFDYFVKEKANNRWVLQDGYYHPGNGLTPGSKIYPDYYRFAWRIDDLFAIYDSGPISTLEENTNRAILSLADLEQAMNASIDMYKESGNLATFKIGIAYQRDLVVRDATRHDAERAFNLIRNRKSFYDGIQHNNAAVNSAEARPLADYMIHCLMKRAHDEDMPVQIHTGYLAGNWGALEGTKAMNLVPLFEKYRKVRFDLFHASWPWTSELGAIAKNYPNVYPDMCWAWTMNPAESERALGEWLDGVPFTKIFGYGADTGLPWGNAGYSMQARIGIARVLEQKIDAGYFSQSTAEEVAEAIMLRNGERFYGLA